MKHILEAYEVYREWNRETDYDKNTKRALYIDFAGIAYGTMYKYIENILVQTDEPELTTKNYDRVWENLSAKNIAEDIFQNKVLAFIPREENFNIIKTFSKIFIAHDHRGPKAKIPVQMIRRKNKIVVPERVRDEVADQFYATILEYKETFQLSIDVIYDRVKTIGEGEWKCIKEIWSDINENNIRSFYILANDFDVVVGAFCLPRIPDVRVNVIWKRQKCEKPCLYSTRIINWSSNSSLEKLLMLCFINVYGNDYVPKIITAANNIIDIKNTILNIETILKKHQLENLHVSLHNISKLIFECHLYSSSTEQPRLDTEEWIISITFVLVFVYEFLMNMAFVRNNVNENKFFENWKLFLEKKDEIEEENNDSRRYVIMMVLWYLCYCVDSFKMGKDVKENAETVFSALPLKNPFTYNDDRSYFENTTLSNKRALFNGNLSCIKNVYNIVKTIFIE